MRLLQNSVLTAVGLGVALLALAGTAHADTVAVLQGLDKTTARIKTIDAPVNKQVRFGDLLITAKACYNHPPEETPESSAFLDISELPPDAKPETKPEHIFSGWMFASSPALSALENPVYDVSVLNCKDSGVAATAPAAAPLAAQTASVPAVPLRPAQRNADSDTLRVTPAPRP
jgi:hypothetical protein